MLSTPTPQDEGPASGTEQRYRVTESLVRNGAAPETTGERTFDSREAMATYLRDNGVNGTGRHGYQTPADESGFFAATMPGAKGITEWGPVKTADQPAVPLAEALARYAAKTAARKAGS